MNPLSYLLTFSEGILTFISPCILPMLPIYFLYLAGASDQDAASAGGLSGPGAAPPPAGKSRVFINSAGFVLGFTLVFTALGATVTSLGQFLTGHRELLQKISGIVMLIFGLNFFGILRLGILNMGVNMRLKTGKPRFVSSAVLGAAFGLGWTPCLGAFLGSALALAGNSKTVGEGVLLLFVYSAGLGIPFILSSVLIEKARIAFAFIGKHLRAVEIASGILLVAAGILVFTGTLNYLNYLVS